jgi:hypothetical protein
MAPSFVTWPMRNSAVWSVFASVTEQDFGSLVLGGHQNRLQPRLCRHQQQVRRASQTLAAEAQLARRLLGTYVEDLSSLARKGIPQFQQEGGFADARLAGEQRRGSGHDATAKDPVEKIDTARESCRLLASQLGERCDSRPGLRGPGPPSRTLHQLLREGVPVAAARAPSQPLG